MPKEKILLKFGGSLITDKSSNAPKVNYLHLESISKILNQKKYNVIIVHGAGSFGHPIAKKFNIINGLNNNTEQKKAIDKTRKQVKELNSILCNVLNSKGLQTVTVAPSDSMKTNGPKNIQIFPFKSFDDIISKGKIPVTFGDVTDDLLKGVTVLSGDVLMLKLSEYYKPKFSIFVMDYPGVFDGNPNDLKTKRIPVVNSETIEILKQQTIVQGGTDVTGGLIGKLECAKEMSKFSEVWITNLKSLEGFLNGRENGTKVIT